MADRGFTIRDISSKKGVSLNIPPFKDGKKQFMPQQIQSGRGIASLWIHVERVICHIKNYGVLQSTLPITMILACKPVCAWLTNFQSALIPLPGDFSADEVDRYFKSLEDSDYDADSEMSDNE